jgi:uncharacterized protein with PIN domain
LIAFLNDEAGAELVAAAMQEVPTVEMAAINLLEIAYDAVRRTGLPAAARDVLDAVRELPISIRWDIDHAVIESAASFKVTPLRNLSPAA